MKGTPVVLCGLCVIRPAVPERAGPRDQVTCPACGATDTVEDVMRQATHHATHMAKRDLESRRMRRGSRLTNVTPTRVPVKSLRWISGLSNE